MVPDQGTKILHTMWHGQKKERKKEMVLVDADGISIDPFSVGRVFQRVAQWVCDGECLLGLALAEAAWLKFRCLFPIRREGWRA